jgi:hypothetical protein
MGVLIAGGRGGEWGTSNESSGSWEVERAKPLAGEGHGCPKACGQGGIGSAHPPIGGSHRTGETSKGRARWGRQTPCRFGGFLEP